MIYKYYMSPYYIHIPSPSPSHGPLTTIVSFLYFLSFPIPAERGMRICRICKCSDITPHKSPSAKPKMHSSPTTSLTKAMCSPGKFLFTYSQFIANLYIYYILYIPFSEMHSLTHHTNYLTGTSKPAVPSSHPRRPNPRAPSIKACSPPTQCSTSPIRMASAHSKQPVSG